MKVIKELKEKNKKGSKTDNDLSIQSKGFGTYFENTGGKGSPSPLVAKLLNSAAMNQRPQSAMPKVNTMTTEPRVVDHHLNAQLLRVKEADNWLKPGLTFISI
jgi:hypothetical protein